MKQKDKKRLMSVDAEQVFNGATFEFEDTGKDYKEKRMIAVGYLAGRMVIVGYVPRKKLNIFFQCEKPMNVKSKNIKSNLKKVDNHQVNEHEYDDFPELTDEMMNRAVYKVAGVQKVAPRRRGKQKAPTKIALQIRLPPEVVKYFKAEGAGWQNHIGEVLKKWIKSHPHSDK